MANVSTIERSPVLQLQPLMAPTSLAPLLRLVEQTPPERIIARTLAQLRAGTPWQSLVAAAAVAVSRCTEVPFDHHGGPLHCVTSVRAIFGAVQRLSGDWAYLPVLHSVQLANAQIHADAMGPHLLLELGEGEFSGRAAAEALADAIRAQLPICAERQLRAVLRDQGADGALECILSVALARQAIDDHFLLYPIFAAQTLDLIGWQYAEFVLRPVVRWLASPPLSVSYDTSNRGFSNKLEVYHRFAEIDELIDSHRLIELAPPHDTSADESASVTELGERIGAVDDFDQIPAMMAESIARGVSLTGTLNALSIGTARLHLRSSYGNPLDVHMQNGLVARRYLLGRSGLSLRTKLIALLSWAYGPEIRATQRMLGEPGELDRPAAEVTDCRLDALCEQIERRPPVSDAVYSGSGRGSLRADSGVRDVMALADAYLQKAKLQKGC